jgi:hypothetical protein
MDTSMYYTFSTIAQVLAAFIALSGVFLIFKFQEFKKMALAQAHNFINQIERIETLSYSTAYNCKDIAINLNNLHRAECLAGMETEMNKILIHQAIKGHEEMDDLKRMPGIFKGLETKRKIMLHLAITATIIGSITILYSISILAIVPNIICISVPILIVGVTLASVSIILVLFTIIIALVFDLKYDQII